MTERPVCGYCAAQDVERLAVISYPAPTDDGDVFIALCADHMDTLIAQLTEAKRALAGVVSAPKPNLVVARG